MPNSTPMDQDPDRRDEEGYWSRGESESGGWRVAGAAVSKTRQAHLRLPAGSGRSEVNGQIGEGQAERYVFALAAMIQGLSVQAGKGVGSRDARARGGQSDEHLRSERTRVAAVEAVIRWFKVWQVSGKRKVAEEGTVGGEGGESDGKTAEYRSIVDK